MSYISPFISKILLLSVGVFALHLSVTAQKTAQDYANETSKLYVDGKSKEAQRMVSRGLEVYENDTTLRLLKMIIAKPNEQNQQQQNEQKQDQNQQNEEKQDEQNQNNQNQNDQQQNQPPNDNAEQEKNEKGKISETEAEMILRALENSEKEVQQRLMERKNEDLKQRTIDKNW